MQWDFQWFTVFPKFFIHTWYLLGSITSLVSTLSKWIMAPSYVLEQEDPTRPEHPPNHPYPPHWFGNSCRSSGSGRWIPLEDRMKAGTVCLCEFMVRKKSSVCPTASIFFHRGCLDRWMDHDQMTCPFCTTRLLPSHLREEFDRRLEMLIVLIIHANVKSIFIIYYFILFNTQKLIWDGFMCQFYEIYILFRLFKKYYFLL